MDKEKIIYTNPYTSIDSKKIKKEIFLGKGNWGSVYRFDNDKAIKIIDHDGNNEQYEIISFIKNLNLPNFYKIYDVLYTMDFSLKEYAGTISKYYQTKDIDIYTTSSSYLLDSFNALSESMNILGQHQITAYDFCNKNILLTEEGLIAIDVDFYGKMENDIPKRTIKRNMKQLKESVLHRLLIFNLHYHHKNDFDISKNEAINNAICTLLNLDNSTDIKQFNKILSKYKYPIDYIKEKTK